MTLKTAQGVCRYLFAVNNKNILEVSKLDVNKDFTASDYVCLVRPADLTGLVLVVRHDL